MPVTAIVSFNTSVPTDVTINKLSHALKSSHKSSPSVIGVQVQDPSIIQVTFQLPSFSSSDALAISPALKSFTETLYGVASSPLSTILARLEGAKFEDGVPSFVEFVKIDFPAPKATHTQRTRNENDFARFETLFRKRGPPRETGEHGLVTGWTEEQDGVRSFVLVRSWASMNAFEKAVQSDQFNKGIPILMGWGEKFTIVGTCAFID